MKLFILLTFAFSMPALSAQDISCWNQDCLTSGWTQTDINNGAFTDFQCYRGSCRNAGWIVGGTQNISFYTQCKAGGCFTEGWYQLDRQTQTMQSQVTCVNNNCLIYGWMTYTSSGSTKSECFHNDCSKEGWRSPKENGGGDFIYCKSGGCFKEGWIQSVL
jgi:hypothetical protein